MLPLEFEVTLTAPVTETKLQDVLKKINAVCKNEYEPRIKIIWTEPLDFDELIAPSNVENGV